MTDHPITPPPELVQAFLRSNPFTPAEMTYEQFIATRFARWGADQELEACEKYWMTHGISPQGVVAMRYARRPQPPSLKAQALALVEQHEDGWRPSPKDWDTIRRALKALPE